MKDIDVFLYFMFQGSCNLDIRKNLLMERVVKYWNRLSKEVVESLSLELFQKYVGIGDVV